MPKVLLDPIYSAKPSHCASARKMWLLVDTIIKAHPDFYFRWLIPQDLSEEERQWFPSSPQVELIEYPYTKDRVREYQVFTEQMEHLVAFNGSLWDTDIVITSRTQQVPNMKIVMLSPRQTNMPWTKKVVLFEEMPVMSFKPTVAVGDERVQDMATLLGYCAADDVLITIQHEKDGILQLARNYLAPSQVKHLRDKIQVASPAKVDQFVEKPVEHRFKRGDRPFCLGYTGRMTPSMSNLELVYEIADKNWIMKGDKGFRMVFSTVTVTCRIPPPDFCEVIHLPREEFWKLIRTELDVVICMDVDAGFGMSFFEPIMLGTPMVAPRKAWTESLIGEEYPFLVKNMTEAYAVIKAFHDDYDKMYALFADWQQKVFKPRFEEGGVYAANYTTELVKKIETFQTEVVERYRTKHPVKAKNSIVQAINDYAEGKSEIVMFEVLQHLSDSGAIESLGRKLEETRLERGVVWATAWNDFRLALMAHHGWMDASNKVGHLKRRPL